jgi:hypothetical protein
MIVNHPYATPFLLDIVLNGKFGKVVEKVMRVKERKKEKKKKERKEESLQQNHLYGSSCRCLSPVSVT